jgi:hypothetical protein
MSIALSLTLVFDKAFNGGEIAHKLFEHGSAAKHWVAHAGAQAAHSVSDF